MEADRAALMSEVDISNNIIADKNERIQRLEEEVHWLNTRLRANKRRISELEDCLGTAIDMYEELEGDPEGAWFKWAQSMLKDD